MGEAGKVPLLSVVPCLCTAAAAVALLLHGVSVTDRRCFFIAVHMCVFCGVCQPNIPALFETPATIYSKAAIHLCIVCLRFSLALLGVPQYNRFITTPSKQLGLDFCTY